MEYLTTFTGKSGRVLRGTANRLWGGFREVHFHDLLQESTLHAGEATATPTDTSQKKTLEKKDGRRMSFQKPKGTTEYTVEPRDSLNTIALKFDTTPNELVQLNKLFCRDVVPGQLLFVPDPDYMSSVESSPSLSPISPLSPTSSEVEFEKDTDTDDVHFKEATSSQAHACIRPARVVSSTSEEEEAFTEKFLKINCKYITDGKGTVNGVLLVTPNNIMFDPHKTDPLVQENGFEEYGIMCPMEEVTSAAMYREILDSKIKESVPIDIEHLCTRDFYHFKKITRSNTDEMDSKIRDTGNDSASTAPRSTEESLSEDVFTESELSPIREELISSDELRQDKSSGASSESVQTVNQTSAECCLTNIPDIADAPVDLTSTVEASANDSGFINNGSTLEKSEMELKEADDTHYQFANNIQESLQDSEHQEACRNFQANGDKDSTSTETTIQPKETKPNMCCDEIIVDSSKTETVAKCKVMKEQTQDSESEVEELRKLWKTHTMQQAKEQRDHMQQESQKENKLKVLKADGYLEGSVITKEKRRHRYHKFLCLRVGKPMKKTFVSQASACMQQYAQREKKHEYWFAVPHERTDHLYSFFIQWSPEIYAEDNGDFTREPGFVVVKKNEEPEGGEDSINGAAFKVWEVVSVAEYHRRIDALNTEELRALCRRLKVLSSVVKPIF